MMKILVLASDKGGHFAPFVEEQIMALQKQGCEIVRYPVCGKGFIGYLTELPKLKKIISIEKPNVIHAHFGLCGLLANLQRKVPVATTYHGCDINSRKLRIFSYLSLRLSKHNVFVSNAQKNKVKSYWSRDCSVIPCGVDTKFFHAMDKQDARKLMHLAVEDIIILFSSNFDRVEKNAKLAKDAISLLPGVNLIPLDGYSRKEVMYMYNAADCCLMTSIREGSPQFTKEALACHRPIVSTPVGDVKDQFKNVKGAYICSYDSKDVANKILQAIADKESVLQEDWGNLYDNDKIANKLIAIYGQVIK